MSGYIDTENLDCMENDKLVRLSDVIETVENQCSDGNMWGNENLTLIDARKIIDELSDIPAIDAVPVVHAKWVKKEKIFESGITYARSWWYECSNCGEKPFRQYNAAVMSDYCPWCGASMDEVIG